MKKYVKSTKKDNFFTPPLKASYDFITVLMIPDVLQFTSYRRKKKMLLHLTCNRGKTRGGLRIDNPNNTYIYNSPYV